MARGRNWDGRNLAHAIHTEASRSGNTSVIERCDDQEMTPSSSQPTLVSLCHPSMRASIETLAAQLRLEPRRFGRSATPKPSRSMIERLITPGSIHMGSMVGGSLVAVARVSEHSDLDIAVLAEWRGRSIGSSLLDHAVTRAALVGHERIVLRSSRRSHAVAAIGRRAGASVVDFGDGRVDFIFAPQRRLGLA